ncbi:MAG: NADPH:quinone oxidoreductase family protein, partial [Polymorphobacter sp.]
QCQQANRTRLDFASANAKRHATPKIVAGSSEPMMQIVEAASHASLDGYALREVPIPQPGPGQILVKVKACGVSYVDALVALGRYQVKPPLPHIPGSEIAGTVARLGEGVTGFTPGDRVLAQTVAGFAEYALCPAAAARPLPAAINDAQAVALPLNYLTALHGLRDRAHLMAGERLLVFGAAGGVGAAAVQIGRLLGAEVIGVAATPEKRAAAEKFGAHAVLDRDPDGWRDRLKAIAPGGVDIVYDPATGELFEAAFRSLRWGGRHLVIGFASGNIPALPANLPLMKGAGLLGVDVRQFLQTHGRARAPAYLDEIIAWAASGALVPPVGRVFDFADFTPALALALSGDSIGKTVLLTP